MVPVVERVIRGRDPGGRPLTVVLRAAAPVRDELAGGDWTCSYQVLGLTDSAVRPAHGVDTLQALLLAVRSLEIHVTAQAADLQVVLSWFGDADLGLRTTTEA